MACLFLKLTGLDRFVAASYGAQQQVNRQVEEAIADYRQTETARLAKDMPRKDITLTQDETFTGGLCLVGSDPVSNFIILEQLAQARDQTTWNELMAPALAPLNCEVIQSTSDEGSGILAYLSLRNHQLRGLDLPRKRECLTAIHNFFLTRSDRTTAAERFFGQKPRSMFAAILESVELPPAPLSPPRKP